MSPASQPLSGSFRTTRITAAPQDPQPIQQSLPFLVGQLPLVYIANDDAVIELIDASNNAMLTRVVATQRTIVRVDKTGVFLGDERAVSMPLNPAGRYGLRLPAVQSSFRSGVLRPPVVKQPPRIVKPPASPPVTPPDQS